MKISVLTPTYNRGQLLGNLYKSLKENANYGMDIEWLIMDDESTDDTSNRIKKFQQENKIEIRYFEQKNQGKMVAINQLVEKATGDLIIECDSDDYFTKDAFQIIGQAWEENKDRKDIYGLCFLKYDNKGNNMGKEFQKKETTMFDLYFKEGENGEKAIVFFSKIRKQYHYILERNERFSTEARMHHKMDEKYQIITSNKPIMICEYQEDGYTKNINRQFKENPYGYYEYFKEILQKDFKGVKFSKRLYVIKHYILFSYLTKQYHVKGIKGIENKTLYYLLLVPGMIKSKRFSKSKI